MGISLSRVIALVTEEMLDLVQGDALLHQPRRAGVPHCVGRIVRDRPWFPVLVNVPRPVNGRPPRLSAPIAVDKQPPGAPLRNSGKDHPVRITTMHMPRHRLKDVIRNWHFAPTLGTLRVLLYPRFRVDLNNEETRAKPVNAMPV